MILTEQEIENRVSRIGGTHVKRNNTRARLKSESNDFVLRRVDFLKREVRRLKSKGAKEGDLRSLYGKISYYEGLLL